MGPFTTNPGGFAWFRNEEIFTRHGSSNRSPLPEREVLVLAGRSIYVLHDVRDLDFDPAKQGIAMVIAGHSHRPMVDTANGVLFLNPDSAGRRRFKLPITLATMELTEGAIRPDIHVLVA